MKNLSRSILFYKILSEAEKYQQSIYVDVWFNLSNFYQISGFVIWMKHEKIESSTYMYRIKLIFYMPTWFCKKKDLTVWIFVWDAERALRDRQRRVGKATVGGCRRTHFLKPSQDKRTTIFKYPESCVNFTSPERNCAQPILVTSCEF